MFLQQDHISVSDLAKLHTALKQAKDSQRSFQA